MTSQVTNKCHTEMPIGQNSFTSDSLSLLNEKLVQRDYSAIIQNSELFWQLFCVSCIKFLDDCYADPKTRHVKRCNILWARKSVDFEVSHDQLLYKGDKNEIGHLKISVEKIRKVVSDSRHKNFRLIFNHDGDEKTLVVDEMSKNNFQEKLPCPGNIFSYYILNHLESFFERLGVTITATGGEYFLPFGQTIYREPDDWYEATYFSITWRDSLYILSEDGHTAYYSKQYPEDSYFMKQKTWDFPYLIARAHYTTRNEDESGQESYDIFLNPTDSRGYRSIVSLTAPVIASTFNREYTTKERKGLGILSLMICEVYSKIVPIAQMEIAGNNSQWLDESTGITHIGTPNEPCTLHAHIFGRGNPSTEYIDGCKLKGPNPWHIFDMRGTTSEISGNDRKVPWNNDEIGQVIARLRKEIDSVRSSYESDGLQVEMPAN